VQVLSELLYYIYTHAYVYIGFGMNSENDFILFMSKRRNIFYLFVYDVMRLCCI